jgi:hypothetical protein
MVTQWTARGSLNPSAMFWARLTSREKKYGMDEARTTFTRRRELEEFASN